MKRLLITLLLASCALASADDLAKICTSDFGRTKAISASDFDSVKFPVSVGDLVEAWGLGYRNDQISGSGMIYWRCIDGRFAAVGPVSDLKTILNDPKIDYGDAQVSFFDADVGWYPFPRQISINVAPSRNDFPDSPVYPTIDPRSPSGLSALERSPRIPR